MECQYLDVVLLVVYWTLCVQISEGLSTFTFYFICRHMKGRSTILKFVHRFEFYKLHAVGVLYLCPVFKKNVRMYTVVVKCVL